VFMRLRWLVIAKLPKVPLSLALLALLLLALVFWAGSGRAGWAQEDMGEDTPSLRFLDAPLALKVSSEDDAKDVYVYVHNGSGLSTDLVFSTRLRDVKGETREVELDPVGFDPKGPKDVHPRSVTSAHLQINADQVRRLALPLKGFLVVSGVEESKPGERVAEVAPGTLQLTITSYEPRQAWLQGAFLLGSRSRVLFAPFVVSALVVMGTYIAFRIKENKAKDYCPLIGHTKALGTGLAFDPSKSWATLLTGLATVVTLFAGATFIPETRVMFTKNDVLVLSLTFGTLLAVAPMIYNGRRSLQASLQAIVSGRGSGGDGAAAPSKAPGSPGSVLALLATSAVILGALLGQLTLAFVLVNEIENLDVTDANRLLLWTIVVLGAGFACSYVSKGVWTVLREEVRWGEELRNKKDKLVAKLRRIDLKDKVLEKLVKDRIRKEIAEIDKQQDLGTRSRELTLL
jgi:hypothetical protein